MAQVLYAFGMTGNGQKQFFSEMEEIVTDSQIIIETEYLEKILHGYALIDQGSPVFYSILVEKILGYTIKLTGEQHKGVNKGLDIGY